MLVVSDRRWRLLSEACLKIDFHLSVLRTLYQCVLMKTASEAVNCLCCLVSRGILFALRRRRTRSKRVRFSFCFLWPYRAFAGPFCESCWFRTPRVTYSVFQGESAVLREDVSYVKLHRYNRNSSVRCWTVTEVMASEVLNDDSCYTLIYYQMHIKTRRNLYFP